jgi:GNAT superfamily N-acetyltransferase
MTITPLRQSDEISVREWARDYLRAHLRHHAEHYGPSLTGDAELDAHIDEHDLVSALWHDVLHADYGDSELVAVLREHHLPFGLILAEVRMEPFLRLPVGVVRWIYVAPEQRGKQYARLLLEAAHDWMQKRGVRARETTLAAGNQAAQALYRKLGYAPLEVRLAAPAGR